MKELKELPAGWRCSTIGEVIANAQSGFACGVRDEKGVIQLRMNNVSTDGGFVWEEFIRVPCDDESIARYKLFPGDIVFNNTNSTELVGKSALFQGFGEDVVYSNHFTRLRVKPDKCDPAYFSYWLNHLWKSRVFENICNRWIGQSAVKPEKLFSLKIPLPPLSEQRRIAALLTEQLAAVEQARKAAEAQLEAARALPAAYLREIFESEEAKKWTQVMLGELGDVISGVTLGRKLRNEPTRDIPYLRVANVKDGYLSLDDIYSIEATENEIKNLRLQHGDLLLTEGGDPDKLGRGTIWQEELEECIHQNHIFRVRFNQREINPQFVSLQMQSAYGKTYFLNHAKQTTGIATINQKVIKAFPVLLPKRTRQDELVEFMNKKLKIVDGINKLALDEFNTINIFPASLLHSAFSGAI